MFSPEEIKDMRDYINREIKPNIDPDILEYTKDVENYSEECPECETEIEYSMSYNYFKPIRCPNCGKFFIPCSLCKDFTGECDYSKCPIEYIKNKREEKNEQ